MVSYAVPTGQLSVKRTSSDQLSLTVKAEVPSLSQGFDGLIPQWLPLCNNTMVQGPTASLGRVSSPHLHSPSPGQSSPKLENQLYRESEREASYEEFTQERKRSKIHDSVHTVSSQMQSQLLSSRGSPGPPGPALKRESAAQVPKYTEPHHSGDRNPSRMAPSHHLSASVSLNPLDEPSPLGLTLRKTPSLLDLISMKLAQGGNGDQISISPDSSAQDNGKNRGSKCVVPSATITPPAAPDKLKASNFPASSLKVGTWERQSVYEGDLVGKCYYAKRKLVWEVLERGLKSKIEIQWSDISAMKACCPENLPGTLEIEVSRPPLFFRETNPQPRKHTLWQATSDFTGGQATICKRHLLQFPEGVLNRHVEKLVQCDSRLKALVEGISIMSTSDHEHCTSLFDGRHQRLPTHQSIGHQTNVHDGNKNRTAFIHPHMCAGPGDAPATSAGIILDPKPEVLLMKMQSNNLASPSSVMDPRGSDESGTSDTEDLRIRDELSDYDLMYSNPENGATRDLCEAKPSCNNLFMIAGNQLPTDRKMLDEIAHVLLGETSSTLSNDQALILTARVGHMSSSLAEEFQVPRAVPHNFLDGSGLFDPNGFYTFNPFHVKTEMAQKDDQLDLLVPTSGNSGICGRLANIDPSLNSLMSCLGRHGSTSELLLNLPRVGSLPQLLETASQVHPGRYDQPLMRQPFLGSQKLR